MRLIESGTEPVRERAHALKQERNAVEIDLVLVGHNIDAGVGDKGVVNTESAGKPGAYLGGWAPCSELAA